MLRSSSYLEQGTEQVKIPWVLIHEYSASAREPTTKETKKEDGRKEKREISLGALPPHDLIVVIIQRIHDPVYDLLLAPPPIHFQQRGLHLGIAHVRDVPFDT
jgi:hypothetical protein